MYLALFLTSVLLFITCAHKPRADQYIWKVHADCVTCIYFPHRLVWITLFPKRWVIFIYLSGPFKCFYIS